MVVEKKKYVAPSLRSLFVSRLSSVMLWFVCLVECCHFVANKKHFLGEKRAAKMAKNGDKGQGAWPQTSGVPEEKCKYHLSQDAVVGSLKSKLCHSTATRLDGAQEGLECR